MDGDVREKVGVGSERNMHCNNNRIHALLQKNDDTYIQYY
jgi:hypothetical protein